MSTDRTRTTQSGQSTLEFALTLPILLLAIAGLFDFTRAIYNYNTLAEIAREGTRYAMVHGSDSTSPVGPGQDAALIDHVKSFATAMDPSRITVSPTWPSGNNKPGSSVRVEVSYSFTPLTWVIVNGSPMTMSSLSEAIIVY